jgi:hypothetical protein
MSNKPSVIFSLCSTTACKDASGAGVPCRDEQGQIMGDQIDSALP